MARGRSLLRTFHGHQIPRKLLGIPFQCHRRWDHVLAAEGESKPFCSVFFCVTVDISPARKEFGACFTPGVMRQVQRDSRSCSAFMTYVRVSPEISWSGSVSCVVFNAPQMGAGGGEGSLNRPRENLFRAVLVIYIHNIYRHIFYLVY